MIENKKIFITGGAGFIGTSIVGRLVDANEIIIYDNLSRNSLKDAYFKNHHNLKVIRGDILDYENLARQMKGADIIIHLAAVAGIDTVIKSPITTMKVNLLGTYNVLEAASALSKLDRLVEFSTSEVFGSYAFRSEENDSTALGAVGNARWTYAVSKLAGEHLAYSYYSERQLPTVSIRPFNIYGPGQVGEGAIHHFITRALRNQFLTIHGDGDQIRSWCYIDDLLDGVMLALEKPEAVGNSFNIGNPRGTITINGLAMAVVRVTYSKSKIVYVPKHFADVELRIPNIDKAKRLLGYEPKIDLEEGLRRTATWYYGKINGNKANKAATFSI
ncbi:MAG: NAD-dependent epimerase/dehydratase family protein [candidate division Zixibacteria bacterium]|jgi:nucleoside-diphosphate-sugar epimerase|nr:NAD-dependent epimerase/dehydratase family protein [candidate division Zixibacteria bacterium]